MAEPAQRSRDAPAGEADLPCLDLLSQGALEIVGRLVEASNATMYATVRHAGRQATCVYKPVAGERPLWDFPTGSLAGREVAAYQVSRAAGWNLVPPTVMRDGPFGPGMCQLWIDCDPSVDLIALARSTGNPSLREMAVFDAVVNNADRKAGHLLPATDGCTAATTASVSPRSTSSGPCSGSGAAGGCRRPRSPRFAGSTPRSGTAGSRRSLPG